MIPDQYVKMLEWTVTQVGTWLAPNSGLLGVRLERFLGGGPQADEADVIEYVTADRPPEVGAVVQVVVREVRPRA